MIENDIAQRKYKNIKHTKKHDGSHKVIEK